MSSPTLRPVVPDDEAFLRAVYYSTRAEELAVVPWTEEQKQAFLEMQFRAQDSHYHTYYAAAEFSVIEQDGIAMGRLYVDRTGPEIRIVDISLLPEYRGAGIGSGFLRQLQAEAAEADKTLGIHVEKFNPALRLYERLGFRPIEDKGVYLLMEWAAVLQPASSDLAQ